MSTAQKTLAQMAAEVDTYCQDKGWREEPISFSEAMALLHEEISEAGSAWRKWGLADHTEQCMDPAPRLAKPEGVGSEFADVFIRLLDDSVIFSVDLEAQLPRHRGAYLVSDSFLENMTTLHTMVSRAAELWALEEDGYQQWFAGVLVFLRQLCTQYGIDLQAEYERKMTFNRARPYKHGNKRR